MTHRVTVLGGGVIGLSVAWELLRSGIDVTLIQRDERKRTTSWSAAGILPPANSGSAEDPIDRLRGLSHEMYPAWIQRLEAVSGLDGGFRKCGGWYLANTPGETASLIGMTGYWDELGVRCESVSMPTLAEREPALQSWSQRSRSASAWWLPDEWQIRPPRLLAALRAACEVGGAAFIDGCHVGEIEASGGVVRYQAEGDWYECDNLVLAAGAWSGELAETFGLKRSVIPIRGQMLLLKKRAPEIHGIINVGHRYLVPRDDGHVLVGSCEEETGFAEGTTPEMIQTLMDFATSIVPRLQDAARVDSWFGIRPMTFDGFPMIGRVPEHDGLFVATGHFRSGWHLAPATARCLKAIITGDTPPVCLDAFGVGKKQIKHDSVQP